MRRLRVLLLVPLVLTITGAVPAASTTCGSDLTAGDLLVVRFAPALDPGSADLLDLLVTGPATDLCGLEVHDGEGILRVGPLAVSAGDVVRLVSTSGLVVPDDARVAHTLAWAEDAEVTVEGRFALAKSGDSIRLLAGTTVVDAVSYGDEMGGDGWEGPAVEAASVTRRIFLRGMDANGPSDTDSASDWTFPRIYRQHQADRESMWMTTTGEVRAFLCPDRCHEEVRMRIDAATTSIDLNLYDLSLREAVEPLAAAAERGVQVRVLLHDRPVGASDRAMDRIAWTVDTLVAAGAEVHTLRGLRFDVNHAKYLVVDREWTVVLSENGNLHGWPPDGVSGNRGWGIAVQDAAVAGWMSDLFDADHGHDLDAWAVKGSDLHDDPHPPLWGAATAPAAGRAETLVVPDGARLRPVVAPDHLGDPGSSPLVAALRDAEKEIWIQQLNLPLEWARARYAAPSPLIGPVLDAAGRGVAVRGTLAGAFQDGNVSTPGNDQTAHVLSALPDVHIGLGGAPSGLVHNKGWIIDPVPGGRNLVVVGSANGNLASQAMNREVDLFVVHPDIAAYFAAALAADLERTGGRAPPAGHAPEQGAEVPAPHVAAPLALLFLAVGLVRCRSIDMSSRLGPARRR